MNNLLLALLFGGIVFYAIGTARKREIFLRRIPGLDAVDEAIGRATELGKPILYLTGAHDMSDPSTIAAAVILGRVAKRTAAYETDLLVPHRDPITMAVCQEITKQAYLEAGKPDLYKDDSNFFITSDQFSYTAAVDGIMLRKKPAANFFMGSLLCRGVAVDGNRREHRRDPNRRDGRRSPTAVLRHHLRLHLDRGGALRRQRLSLQRTGSGRHAARTGHRQGAHPRRARHRDRTGYPRGHARRAVAAIVSGSVQGREMIFLRRQVPLLITLITGLVFAAQYYVPHPASEQMLTSVTKWLQIIGGFALVLGVSSLFHVHAVKIRRKEAGWGYSFVLYVSMLGTIAVGLWSNGKEAVDGTMTAFGWIYNFMMVPLQGTMFAILAFFIASAAYRSFRARSREAAVLLIAAVIVMMGRVPLGEYLIPLSGDLSQWILNVLNASVRRAILIGVSLGTVALSIKIIFGMERSYLGGGKE